MNRHEILSTARRAVAKLRNRQPDTPESDEAPSLFHDTIWYEGTPEEHDKWVDAVFGLKESKQVTLGIHVRIFSPEELAQDPVYDTPAERALTRLGQPTPFAPHSTNRYMHGYLAGIRHAQRVISEELTRNHGV